MSAVPSHLLPKLRKLAGYIVNVYFPLHMDIKYKNSITHGALNLFKEISLIKEHVKSKSDRSILFSVLENNGYFAHPHNVLISMLSDESYEIRKEAVDRINYIRSCENDEISLQYYLPKLNFNAADYKNLCSMKKVSGKWVFLNRFGDNVLVSEPPLLKGVDLSRHLVQPYTSDLPCHTQSVERMVKLTTEVSKVVCGRVNQCAEGMLVLQGRKESKLSK